MKANSVNLMILSVIGVIACIWSTFTIALDVTQSMCVARIYAVPLSPLFVLAPIAAKQARIFAIFNVKTLKKSSGWRDSKAILFTLALLAPQLLITFIWHGVASPQTQFILTDPIRPALGHTACSSGAATLTFEYLSLAYYFILLILNIV